MRMQNLISVIPKIINDSSNIVSINLLIKNNWSKVCGSDILLFADFEKAIFSKFNQITVLNVFIRVIGAAIIFVKTKVDTIKNSIQGLTGINDVNIIFHQALNINMYKQQGMQCL